MLSNFYNTMNYGGFFRVLFEFQGVNISVLTGNNIVTGGKNFTKSYSFQVGVYWCFG